MPSREYYFNQGSNRKVSQADPRLPRLFPAPLPPTHHFRAHRGRASPRDILILATHSLCEGLQGALRPVHKLSATFRVIKGTVPRHMWGQAQLGP